MVRPFLGHAASSRQSLTARHSRAVDRSRERHVSGRSLFGSNQTGKRSGTNPANGRSVFESNHPRTGYHHMTICVHDLWRAVFGDGFVQSIDAEVRVHRVTQPPTQDLACGPVHDRHEIQEPVPHRHEGDIGTLDLVRALYHHLSQYVREDRMLGVRLAGSGSFVDRLQAHSCHQSPDAMTPDNRAFPTQVGYNLS